MHMLAVSIMHRRLQLWKSGAESRHMCGALRDLLAFAQFKKHEKHPWRSVTFTKSNTPPWVFFMFFKLYKWYQIAQNITI